MKEGRHYGLTGGIASGKSTAARELESRGWRVIDSDAIVHRLYERGQAGYEKVVDAFGGAILDSSQQIDRSALGRLVFSDAQRLALLNSLIHPLVRSEWLRQRQDLFQESPQQRVVVVIPLLFETGAESYFDEVACIACAEEVQLRRLAGRGHGPEAARERLARQATAAEKMNKSHVVLWNNGSLELLKAQAGLLDQRWTAQVKN
jgi:dephospho-CoA kinase